MTTPTFSAIGLVVADMPAAVAFYRRLGLEFDSDTEGHVESRLPGGVRLLLDTEESVTSFTPNWVPPSGGSRAALAFQFANPAAVDAMFQELIDAGYRAERAPWDAFWGQRYATVLDPDGTGVDLFAELAPASES